MKPPLYLHIGHGKVASSTIQAALRQQAGPLRQDGFLIADGNLDFPEDGPVDGVPVDYLARDFTSIRSALLDFAAQRYPKWQERIEAEKHAADGKAKGAVLDILTVWRANCLDLLGPLKKWFGDSTNPGT